MPDSGGILYIKAQNARLISWAAVVPANGTAGYVNGGLLMLRALTAGAPKLYINTGTNLACQFEELGEVSNSFGATGIIADVVAEFTAAHGVLVDSVLCKDGQVQGTACILTNTISEFTAAAGVTIDAALIKDGQVQGTACILTNTISEFTAAAGVTIDAALIKDGQLQGTACILTNTISEFTAAAGVTIDAALIKDGQLQGTAPLLCDTISEFNANTGVTVDGVLFKDGQVTTNTINISDNSSTAFRLMENANAVLVVNSSNSAEVLTSNYRFACRATASLAAAGNSQGTAASIDASKWLTRISSSTAGSAEAVVLPTAATIGDEYYVFNDTVNTIKLFPGSSCAINAVATNGSINVTTKRGAWCVAISGTQWSVIFD